MRLYELFANSDPGVDDSGDMMSDMRANALDMLMPFAVHGVPFVTIQNVIDKLGEQGSGIVVDRALIMNLLDPNKINIVKKIEGDKIYLTTPAPEGSERSVNDQQKQKDSNKVSANAQAQAKKQVTQDDSPLS